MLLFLFLVAINLMSSAFKVLGGETATDLFSATSNPFAALTIGILATVLVQSSSVSTSTIVALVGSGTVGFGVEQAVPMIMGANIGTTITNTLVAMGSLRRRAEFRRAFAAAIVHDFFNLMTVAILLTVELLTGFLAKSARAIAGLFTLNESAEGFHSPIKAVVKSVGGFITDGFGDKGLGMTGTALGVAILVVALGMIFFSLATITKTMRVVIAAGAERAMNAALGKSGLVGILIGTGLTVAVQSSSITTSLLVPLCAAGILTLKNAFPIMLGANIGTTITALIASLATDRNGLTIALVHVLFNVIGVGLFYPFPPIRKFPVRLAKSFAKRAAVNRWWVAAYVLGVFVLLPLLGVFIFS